MKVNKSRTTTTTCTCCWDKPKLAKSHQRDVLIDAKSWVHALIGLDTNGDCYHAHGTLTHSNVQELHATEGFVAVSQVIITPVLPQPSKGFSVFSSICLFFIVFSHICSTHFQFLQVINLDQPLYRSLVTFRIFARSFSASAAGGGKVGPKHGGPLVVTSPPPSAPLTVAPVETFSSGGAWRWSNGWCFLWKKRMLLLGWLMDVNGGTTLFEYFGQVIF